MTKMEKNSEIKIVDGIIPKLIKVDTLEQRNDMVWKLFMEISNTDDYDDVDQDNYLQKNLDLFNRVMDEGDERLNLFTNDYFCLSQESKFLDFFKRVFELNNKQCIINLGEYSKREELVEYLYYKLKNLDELDTVILLGQVDVLSQRGAGLYKIENVELLKTFIKLGLRIGSGGLVYFEKIPLLVESAFDMRFILTLNDKEGLEQYRAVAESEQLHLL